MKLNKLKIMSLTILLIGIDITGISLLATGLSNKSININRKWYFKTNIGSFGDWTIYEFTLDFNLYINSKNYLLKKSNLLLEYKILYETNSSYGKIPNLDLYIKMKQQNITNYLNSLRNTLSYQSFVNQTYSVKNDAQNKLLLINQPANNTFNKDFGILWCDINNYVNSLNESKSIINQYSLMLSGAMIFSLFTTITIVFLITYPRFLRNKKNYERNDQKENKN